LIPNYAAVAFQTELGGNSAYLSRFRYAGSASTYSFGLFQYDVGKQGAGSDVQNFLTSIGFSATQISQLSQHGGLSTTEQTALSAQLNTALQNPANQATLDQLNINWAQGLVNQLQSALDVIYQANPGVALQIYGSQELQLRLMDYANQYHLDSTGATAYMTQWLSDQAVQMASGDTLSLTAGQSLTGAQIDNFIMNTQQGVADLNGNVTTRLNALDSVVPALSLGSAPVIDVSGVSSPVVLDPTGTAPSVNLLTQLTPLLDAIDAMRKGYYDNGTQCVPPDDNFLTTIQGLFHQAEITRSPLVLDLNGDGVSTIAMSAGVHFDQNNNRFSELSGWVAPSDGLLVRDLNGNGQIDGGSELFSNNTLLASILIDIVLNL
jgi:hypothetical protein